MFDENLSKNIKALAYEKSIDVERVFKALEDALATAARKYYKTREPMETIIDRNSGEMKMYVYKEVVTDENYDGRPDVDYHDTDNNGSFDTVTYGDPFNSPQIDAHHGGTEPNPYAKS